MLDDGRSTHYTACPTTALSIIERDHPIEAIRFTSYILATEIVQTVTLDTSVKQVDECGAG